MFNNFPLAQSLLDWYASNGREMPWRVRGGAHSDPYAVWISEIMLQQTTVRTVEAYFIRWMNRFPTIQSLAAADIHDVLLAWQGLGYYTRAKKVHECAKVVVDQYGGEFPADRETLLTLPGIGPYTASSICCFAFNLPETVVDGNVIRVIARLHGLTHAVTKDEIYELARQITPAHAGADYASAIMDLGALVCTAGRPACLMCPWSHVCRAYHMGNATQIPLINKPKRAVRQGIVYLIRNQRGAYFIRIRPGKGLLSGLYEFPWIYDEESPLYPVKPDASAEQISHVFTHFNLTLRFQYVEAEEAPFPDGIFVLPSDFKQYPFSTLMRKVIKRLPR